MWRSKRRKKIGEGKYEKEAEDEKILGGERRGKLGRRRRRRKYGGGGGDECREKKIWVGGGGEGEENVGEG